MCWNSVVSDALITANHPQYHIRYAKLGLQKKAIVLQSKVGTEVQEAFLPSVKNSCTSGIKCLSRSLSSLPLEAK